MAAFCGVGDVSAALGRAEAALRDAGLVEGEHAPEAVLGGRGLVLRPGPAAVAATRYGARLTGLLTNGVAFRGPGYFNAYAVGFATSCDCPACEARIDAAHPAYSEQMGALGMAGYAFSQGQRETLAMCQLCGAQSPVQDWRLDDPVFVADMAVEFWNWPYLERPRPDGSGWWFVDAAGMLEEAVGRPATVSGYKI